ncbi:MAG: bifunctional oligoribonuclease/PAP phosphatase NrnA [Candidatus Abyssubacteria bacterium]
MKNEFSRLIDCIERYRRFFLLSHIDPDGDAIGSLLALLQLLRRRGKEAIAYDRDGVPEIYRFLRGSEGIASRVPTAEQFDVAIFLECPNIERAGPECVPLVGKIPLIVNLDHHMENSQYGAINLIDPEMCAVAEIVFDLYAALKEPMDLLVAEALYTAIMTDTGSFRYPNTTPRSHELAAELIRLGVSPSDVHQKIYENLRPAAALIAARAHSTLEIRDSISCITITRRMLQETGATPEDTHEIVNFGRPIEGVEVALLFREIEDGVKVSLRSKNYLDVSKIAAKFGGGGHVRAAGCNIKGDMKHAKALIYSAVEEALREAHRVDAK